MVGFERLLGYPAVCPLPGGPTFGTFVSSNCEGYTAVSFPESQAIWLFAPGRCLGAR